MASDRWTDAAGDVSDATGSVAPPSASPRARAGSPVDRWVLVPIAVGIVFAAIQVVHVLEMLYYWPVGVLLEGVLPLILAVVVTATGPWLYRRGYAFGERRRIVGWMGLVALLVGLLFGWALSHQHVVGEPFPHAEFVTTTNLIAGSLIGLVVGIYDVRALRRRRAVQRERAVVERQRARLSVLNRVLRHNIRTDANVILGTTEHIADETTGAIADQANLAVERTENLVALSERARDIQRTLDVDPERLEPVDVEALVTDIAREYAPHGLDAIDTEELEAVGVEGSAGHDGLPPGSAVSVDIDAAVGSIVTSEAVLSKVLEELLENAAAHAGTASLRVRVTGRTLGDDRIELVVADNGTGIPEEERRSLAEDRETALQHASGLGLWFVKWGIDTLGGETAFGESDAGGSAVRLRLPREPPVALQSG